jgi:serine protease Do
VILIASGASSYSTAFFLGYLNKEPATSTQVVNVADDANVVNIVNRMSVSVVSITTQSTSYGWFGARYTSQGAGTGIIVDNRGYILTNNHVVDGSDTLTVLMDDNKELPAKIITTDAGNDLALIKVTPASGSEAVAAKIGDSGTLKVGEEVIAIGNVLGRYRNSVTKGIVSGLGRPVTAQSSLYGNLEQLDDLIQTDAAINAGNSGGPLVNMKGEVIGINTATDGQAENIGFSIPINHAKTLFTNIK